MLRSWFSIKVPDKIWVLPFLVHYWLSQCGSARQSTSSWAQAQPGVGRVSELHSSCMAIFQGRFNAHISHWRVIIFHQNRRFIQQIFFREFYQIGLDDFFRKVDSSRFQILSFNCFRIFLELDVRIEKHIWNLPVLLFFQALGYFPLLFLPSILKHSKFQSTQQMLPSSSSSMTRFRVWRVPYLLNKETLSLIILAKPPISLARFPDIDFRWRVMLALIDVLSLRTFS